MPPPSSGGGGAARRCSTCSSSFDLARRRATAAARALHLDDRGDASGLRRSRAVVRATRTTSTRCRSKGWSRKDYAADPGRQTIGDRKRQHAGRGTGSRRGARRRGSDTTHLSRSSTPPATRCPAPPRSTRRFGSCTRRRRGRLPAQQRDGRLQRQARALPNQFGLIGGEANAIAAGQADPLSSMTPTIVLEGRPAPLRVGQSRRQPDHQHGAAGLAINADRPPACRWTDGGRVRRACTTSGSPRSCSYERTVAQRGRSRGASKQLGHAIAERPKRASGGARPSRSHRRRRAWSPSADPRSGGSAMAW